MLVAFILGLVASKWLETILVRSGLKILRHLKWEKPSSSLQRYATENGLETKAKGKRIDMNALRAAKALQEGTFEEMLDKAGYGDEVSES